MRARPALWCQAPAFIANKVQAIGWVATIYALALLAGSAALAAVPTSAQQDTQELRRAQEQENQLREQQKREPDVRNPAPVVQSSRLIEGEFPCITIRQIELRGDELDQFESSRFGWVLDTLAGPQGDDGPLRKCLGPKSMAILLKRAQDALIGRGYITTNHPHNWEIREGLLPDRYHDFSAPFYNTIRGALYEPPEVIVKDGKYFAWAEFEDPTENTAAS